MPLLTFIPFRRRPLQKGQALAEFALLATPLLLAGLSGIELAHWHFTRQAVSLALAEAARAGATRHARPDTIEAAFEQALLPLYAAPTPEESARRLGAALARRRQHMQGVAWRIDVLNPGPGSFADFHDASLQARIGQGHAVIDSDYQAEQHDRHRQRGWPQGRGPVSGQTIYEANTLILHLTWLHEPLTPGMRPLMRLLAPARTDFAARAMRTGYLPIRREIRLGMQSHAIDWPAGGRGQVGLPQPTETNPGAPPLAPCVGIWCRNSDEAGVTPIDSSPSTALDGEAAQTLPADPPDPACGVTLCCIEG